MEIAQRIANVKVVPEVIEALSRLGTPSKGERDNSSSARLNRLSNQVHKFMHNDFEIDVWDVMEKE